MKLIIAYLSELFTATIRGWQRFWFTPADPATLGLIRLLGGGMLFYTHLVWTIGLEDFFGPHGWLSPAAVGSFHAPKTYTWSYFWWIESPHVLWTVHIAALVVFALLMLGLFTRVVSVLAFLITVSYVNRVPGALFGLDQINGLLALYLMVGPSGAAYSLDRLWQARRAGHRLAPAGPYVSANIAIRLIQVHMCVIYLFAGLSKLQGPTWWDGTAMWFAIGNLEYQSWDLLWLANWPIIVNIMTHVTIAWEISYCALVWPRLTRPLVLLLAIPLHGGICLGLGMMTFGLVMLIGNLAFVPPWLVRAVVEWPNRLGAERDASKAVPGTPARPRRSAKRRSTAGVATGHAE